MSSSSTRSRAKLVHPVRAREAHIPRAGVQHLHHVLRLQDLRVDPGQRDVRAVAAAAHANMNPRIGKRAANTPSSCILPLGKREFDRNGFRSLRSAWMNSSAEPRPPPHALAGQGRDAGTGPASMSDSRKIPLRTITRPRSRRDDDGDDGGAGLHDSNT